MNPFVSLKHIMMVTGRMVGDGGDGMKGILSTNATNKQKVIGITVAAVFLVVMIPVILICGICVGACNAIDQKPKTKNQDLQIFGS